MRLSKAVLEPASTDGGRLVAGNSAHIHFPQAGKEDIYPYMYVYLQMSAARVCKIT